MKRLTLPACLALALLPLVALAQSIPEPDVASLGASFLAALSTKNYILLAAVVVMGGVWLARFIAKQFPGKFATWLTTPRGSAVLAFVGGTVSLLLGAMRSGIPVTLDLVLGCIGTALTASGLWSVGKAVVEKKPAVTPSMAPQVCSAADIAQGKPGCPS